MIEKSREQGRQKGSQVWISPPAIPSPPWSRFLLLFSCHSQLYFINHIRSEIGDPKQVNTLLVVFYCIILNFPLIITFKETPHFLLEVKQCPAEEGN